MTKREEDVLKLQFYRKLRVKLERLFEGKINLLEYIDEVEKKQIDLEAAVSLPVTESESKEKDPDPIGNYDVVKQMSLHSPEETITAMMTCTEMLVGREFGWFKIGAPSSHVHEVYKNRKKWQLVLLKIDIEEFNRVADKLGWDGR